MRGVRGRSAQSCKWCVLGAVVKINQIAGAELRKGSVNLIGCSPDSRCLDMLANASDAFHCFSSRRASRDLRSSSMAVEKMSPRSRASWLATRRFSRDWWRPAALRACDRSRSASFPGADETALIESHSRNSHCSPSPAPSASSMRLSSCCACSACFGTKRGWLSATGPSSQRAALSSAHRVGDLHWKTCCEGNGKNEIEIALKTRINVESIDNWVRNLSLSG